MKVRKGYTNFNLSPLDAKTVKQLQSETVEA
jgi:hypothetical protein